MVVTGYVRPMLEQVIKRKRSDREPWTPEQDARLWEAIDFCGQRHIWPYISEHFFGGKRTATALRQRYLKLKGDIEKAQAQAETQAQAQALIA